MTLEKYLAHMRRELRIKYPVRVDLYAGDETPDGYDGAYRFNRRKHRIDLAAQPSRGLLAILTHELCHAAVTERHGFRVETHGKEFQKIAQEAIDKAAALGYIMVIFQEELDT